ncbi:hypothetical protein KQI84_06185 [bacterium]|nr:hypothetical protein [bacterium]
MAQLVSLKFAPNEMPLRYTAPGIGDLSPSEFVVAEREGSQDIGIIAAVEFVSTDQLKLRQERFRRILRRATAEEKEAFFVRKSEESRALNLCKEKARELKLPMKISTVRIDPGDGRVIYNFTSDQRVDFRQLVRELSLILRARIELWQIGVRDEAKVIDGFGVCGLRTCCSQWLPEFRPISIRMAKDQDINLPPSKLSGQCGRLLCCLSYEVDQYRDMNKRLMPKGATIKAEGKEGIIIDRNILTGEYTVKMQDGPTLKVSIEDMEDVRVPDQMKSMAKVLEKKLSERAEARGLVSPEPPPAKEPEPKQPAKPKAKAKSDSEEDSGEDSDKKGRRRRRRRSRDKSKGGDGAKEQAAASTEKKDDKSAKPARTRSRRGGAKKKDGKPQAPKAEGAEGEAKSGGRRRRRRRKK